MTYDDISPELLAKAELDALPKDATHPFKDLPRAEATIMAQGFIDQRVLEISDDRKKRNVVRPKQVAAEALADATTADLVIAAYRNACASFYETARNPKRASEYSRQEKELLKESGMWRTSQP